MFNEDSIMTYEDFNSIESKINELNSRITTLGYTVDTYAPKTWVKKDFLIYTYLNNIENGIENLGKGYFRPYGWQNKKTWTKGMSFSYRDVNKWITNLNLIEERLNNESSQLLPSDTLYPNDSLYPH